jgi:hypothetical protein
LLLSVGKYVLVDEVYVDPAKGHYIRVARGSWAKMYRRSCCPTTSGVPGTNVLNSLIFSTAAAGCPSWADANSTSSRTSAACTMLIA